MSASTGREIILANIERSGASRAGFTFDGRRLNDAMIRGVRPSGYSQRRWRSGDREYYDDEWGNVWVRMAGRSAKGEIHAPVIRDWSDMDSIRMPHYDTAGGAEELRQFFGAQPAGLFKIASVGGWIFDNARYLRKLEVYLMDLALHPDELRVLHDKVAGVYERKIHIAGRAGADAVFLGEDMGTQQGLLFSPAMFRDYFKPLYTRLMHLAAEYGMKVMMHSCGMNWEILDDLIDCGVNVFQFDQPAVYDMPALAEKLRRRRVALWSPLDIQKFLPTGDRRLIERETDRMIDLFRGGLILKNYPDLAGIGVTQEWDGWFYNRALLQNGVAIES